MKMAIFSLKISFFLKLIITQVLREDSWVWPKSSRKMAMISKVTKWKIVWQKKTTFMKFCSLCQPCSLLLTSMLCSMQRRRRRGRWRRWRTVGQIGQKCKETSNLMWMSYLCLFTHIWWIWIHRSMHCDFLGSVGLQETHMDALKPLNSK